MNDEGVSQILGAILVVSVLVTTMTTMQTTFVPEWTEEAENNHMQKIINEFGNLKAITDGQKDNATGNPQTVPMDLKPATSGRWLKTEVTGGSLLFQPGGAGIQVKAETLTVLNKNGREQSLLKEDWETVADKDDLEDIATVTSLRLRMTSPEGVKLEFKKNAYVRLDLTDKHGNFAGMFMTYVPEKEKEDVWVHIQNADGEVLLDQEFASDVKYKEHSQFWVDTMDPSWPWISILEAAEAPMSMSISYDFPELDPNKWPSVSYAATYSRLSETGREYWVGGGSGLQLRDFSRIREGGVIEYEARNQELPDMRLVFEHGALLNVQEGRSAVLMPPSFRASSDGETLFVDLSLPILVGPSDAATKTGTVAIVTQAERVHTLQSTTDQLDLRLDTQYPSAWATYFVTELSSHGMVEGSGFSVTEAADHVNVTLEGPSTDPRIFDIQFNYWEPQVRIEFI